MCIAIYKKSGVNPPTKQVLKTCFDKNPQGAGFMYVDKINDTIQIKKGYMTFNDFMKAYNNEIKNPLDYDIVFHFRISTQGGINPNLCHPYPLTTDYERMRELSTSCDIGIAHNGIIELTSERAYSGFNLNYGLTKPNYNDTMTFIKEYVSLIVTEPKWYFDKYKVDLIGKLIGSSRFCILDKKGHCELIGNWILDNGIYYSNNCYKSNFDPNPTNWSKGGAKKSTTTKSKSTTLKPSAYTLTKDNYIMLSHTAPLKEISHCLNNYKGVKMFVCDKSEVESITKRLKGYNVKKTLIKKFTNNMDLLILEKD